MGVELDQESFERGWQRAMGTPTPDPAGEFGRFSAAIAFGDVWNREELTPRERRLVVLTVLAVGGREGPCGMHLEAALRKGELDPASVDELTVTLTAYAGLPVGTEFAAMAARVLGELADEDSRD